MIIFFLYSFIFPLSWTEDFRKQSLNQNIHTNILWQGWDVYVQSENEGKKWKREMRQETGAEMNPVACDFTRKKCSQLLSYMGYLWTSLQQSLYLGAMVWVKKWVFLMVPLSFIGQVHLRGHEFPTLWLYHTGLPHSRWGSQSLTAPSGQWLGSGCLPISWGLLIYSDHGHSWNLLKLC